MKGNLKRRLLSCVLSAVVALTSVLATPIYSAAENTPDQLSDADLCHQSFELYPNGEEAEQVVTLEGLMPEGASAEAIDVSAEHDGIAAYDITITDSQNNEFQPYETSPVLVEITDPVIPESENLELWHIKDDGEREQIFDFTVEEGKISFYAAGFSVYEIVEAPTTISGERVTSIDQLTGSRADDGFYLFYRNTEPLYFKNTINDNQCFYETTNISEAAVWYFEQEGTDYKIYTYVDGVKKYIHNVSGNFIKLSETEADTIELTECGIKNDPYKFYFKKNDEDKWLQHSNGGGGIRYYTDNKNETNCAIELSFADSVPTGDDPYSIGGETFGLMSYGGGTIGEALMADAASNYEKLYQIDVLNNEHVSNFLYVSQNSDITMWTFVNVGLDNYKLRADTGVYLGANGNNFLSLVSDEASAASFKLTPNSDNSVYLYCNDINEYIYLDNASFKLSNSKTKLYFTKKSEVTGEDTVTYTANRISVSDGELAHDGSELIVYTRIWDDTNKRYDFYALNHDGSLKQVYAYGDKIMWLDDTMNTLIWKYTVYYNSDGTENGYYELKNTYSDKYLAPQLTENQILSDEKIGILMPGRKYEVGENGNTNYGEYYSNIIAWDKGYYEYVGVQADKALGEIEPSPLSKASTFYFATFDDIYSGETAARLHPVDTIDNTKYGITMRMIDFGDDAKTTSSGSDITQNYFGGMYGDEKGLLSANLYKDGEVNKNGSPLVAKSNNEKQIGLDFGNAFQDARFTNHFFINSIHESSGYFEFDSCQNFATLYANGEYTQQRDANDNLLYVNSDGRLVNEDMTDGVANQPIYDFTVYRELGTSNESKTTTKHGQFFPYNTITPGTFSTNNPQNLYSANAIPGDPKKGLLSDDDPRKYERLYLVNGKVDYYLGMEMEAEFVQTPSGLDAWGHDIIFEFTGDDDFWFYVDGVLVLDLGGIHSAQEGTVNFRTGKVVINGETHTLREIFKENYKNLKKEEGMSDTQAETAAEDYVSDLFKLNKEKDPANQGYVFTDYTTHDMKIYYMERGAGASNLHMRFNLSAVTPGNVLFAKQLTGISENDDMDFDLVQYPFKIQYKIAAGEDEDWRSLSNKDADDQITVTYQNSTQTVKFAETYTPPSGVKTYENVFFLIPGKNIEIHFPDNAMYYQVIECAVNTDIYDEVTANNGTVRLDDVVVSGNIKDLISEAAKVKEQPTIAFDNKVKPENVKTLFFTKKLYDEGVDVDNKSYQNELHYDPKPDKDADMSKIDNTTFNYRLYLSDGVTDELKLADMHRYYVLDPENYLCQWNPTLQRFERFSPASKTVTDMTDEQKEAVTFHTSRFGSISNIPANYTVQVPGLMTGMLFKVEERDYEIPIGYDLIDFECKTALIDGVHEQASYQVVDQAGGITNSVGRILAYSDAYMEVSNRRGFGLEAEKVWSDKDFTNFHGNVYFAVFLDDSETPIDDTLRVLEYPDTTVKYFFKSLEENKTLANYHIAEVKLDDAVVEDGKVTAYTSITRLCDGDTQNISVDNINSDKYTVRYTEGIPIKTGAQKSENVRYDTVTNNRKGGIEIYLYEWNTVVDESDPDFKDNPLAGGIFNLFKFNDNTNEYDIHVGGDFVSGNSGLVTTLYGFDKGEKYKLVETKSPNGYIGMTKPVYFEIDQDDCEIHSIISWSNENDPDGDDDADKKDGKNWAEYKTPSNAMAAKIDIYNKPYTLMVKKLDGTTNKPLEGVEFQLYKDAYILGVWQKAFEPIVGYESLVTDSEGVIPKIDNTLTPLQGKLYYLTEVTPLPGYEGLSEDVRFNVSDIGVITCENEQYLGKVEEMDGNTLHVTYTISVPNTVVRDYYFDIEKIAFIDKNIHGNAPDSEQKFIFRVDRFEEGTTDFIDENVKESFYVTVNCDQEMTYISDANITVGAAQYNLGLYLGDDNTSPTQSEFISSGGSVQIRKTYDSGSKTYIYPAAIRRGVQSVCVKNDGIYRVTEVSDWSKTDYDFWSGSNVYKGNGSDNKSSLEIKDSTTNDGAGNSVIFSVKKVNANDYDKDHSENRPTASFTNSETEFAYLSAQAYAENTINMK